MNVHWYENFFHGIALDFWRKAIPPEQTRADADFLERALRLQPGARVLDVPCGLGRHTVELASRGYRMTGVDISAEGIEETRKRAAAAGLTIECRHTDMRELPWQSEFDGGFCFGNSFGYLDPEGTRAFFQAVSRALKQGARFVMDSGTAAESVLPNMREHDWMQIEDILFLRENRYHPAESCMETTYTFVRDGQTDARKALHWIYTVREIRALLAEAGLIAEQVHGSLEGEPFQVGSRYLVLVAEKR